MVTQVKVKLGLKTNPIPSTVKLDCSNVTMVTCFDCIFILSIFHSLPNLCEDRNVTKEKSDFRGGRIGNTQHVLFQFL